MCCVFYSALQRSISRARGVCPTCAIMLPRRAERAFENMPKCSWRIFLAFSLFRLLFSLCSAANKPPTRKCNKCFNFSKKSNCFDRGGLSSASWRGSRKKHVGIGTECLLQFFSLLFICSLAFAKFFSAKNQRIFKVAVVFFFVSLLLLPYAEWRRNKAGKWESTIKLSWKIAHTR